MQIVKLAFFFYILVACGTNSLVDCDTPRPGIPCKERSVEENARRALKDGDLDQAITLLEAAIDEIANRESVTPQEMYRLHPLLASVYSARGDIDLVRLSQAQFGAKTGVMATLTTVLPSPKDKGVVAYRQCIADVRIATQKLEVIPLDLIEEKKEDIYGKSVAFQKSLYNTAYSVMNMNLFAISATSGTLDKNQLSTMTEADAVEILRSLEAAGKTSQSDNPVLQQKISDTLASIDSEPGAGKKDKLAEYIAKNQ
jgi:hypothetical protein